MPIGNAKSSAKGNANARNNAKDGAQGNANARDNAKCNRTMLKAMLKAKLKTIKECQRQSCFELALEEPGPGLRGEELPDWGLFYI